MSDGTPSSSSLPPLVSSDSDEGAGKVERNKATTNVTDSSTTSSSEEEGIYKADDVYFTKALQKIFEARTTDRESLRDSVILRR